MCCEYMCETGSHNREREREVVIIKAYALTEKRVENVQKTYKNENELFIVCVF